MGVLMARKSMQEMLVAPTSGGYALFVGHAYCSHGYSSTKLSYFYA